jgi:hypothetical protein
LQHNATLQGVIVMPTIGSSRTFLLSSLLALIALPRTSHGADLILTKSFLDSRNGFVDFKQITHTLGPGDRVLLDGHTRASLFLVNLVYGEPGNPIVVTNTGPQPFAVADVGPDFNHGIRLWGVQHVIFIGTPLPGEPYGIKVLAADTVGIDVDYTGTPAGTASS